MMSDQRAIGEGGAGGESHFSTIYIKQQEDETEPGWSRD